MAWSTYRRDDPEQLQRELRDREYELEEMREQRNRELEREVRERQERRRELQERMREAEREATTWDEAFRKNRALYQRELREEQAQRAQMLADPDPEMQALAPDPAFWEEAITEIDIAERIRLETRNEFAPQIIALREQILALEAAMREQIAERFEAACEHPHTGFADAMRADDPASWINW